LHSGGFGWPRRDLDRDTTVMIDHDAGPSYSNRETMMKRWLAFLFRHGTPISWALLGLAWVPLLLVWGFGEDSWRTFGMLLLCGALAVVWTMTGALLGAATAIRSRRKGWAVAACAVNLLSLFLFLGALSS
jgi:hypothetical protein